MALDLEEQEQIDELKTWWNKNGKAFSALLIIALLAFVGYKAWNYWQHKQALQASEIYQELLVTKTSDLDAINEKTALLTSDYASTPYAGRAALYAAKLQYQAKANEGATANLNWAMEHAKEKAIRAMARFEAATLLVEAKEYDKAMDLLDANLSAGFDGLFWDLKGDILAVQGKTKEAKAAYERALTKLNSAGKYRIITEQKLAALG